MSKLILHIGMGKTGTSALQRVLADNITLLEERGFSYIHPSSYRESNPLQHGHGLLVWALCRKNRTFLKSFQNQLKTKAHSHTAIVSAEAFFEFPERTFLDGMKEPFTLQDKSDYIKVVRDFFGEVFSEIQVVAYLRRQDEVLQAWTNQFSKRAPRFCATPAAVEEKMRLSLDYESTLDLWARHFGREAITVRVYEQGQIDNTVSDFWQLLGMSDPPPRPSSGNGVVNPRISKPAMDYLNVLKRHAVPIELWRFIRDAVWEREKLSTSGLNSSHNLMSHAEKEHLLARFAAGNARVARTYLGRDELFLQKPDPAEPIEQLTLEKSAELSAFLLEQLNDQKTASGPRNISINRSLRQPRIGYPIRRHWHRWKSRLRPDPRVLQSAELDVIRRTAARGTPVITFANSGYRDVLDIWLAYVRKNQINTAIVFCLDTALYQELQDAGVTSIDFSQQHRREATERRTRDALWKLRVQVYHEFVENGYPVIHSDADAFWLRNPFADYFDSDSSDIIFSPGTIFPHEVFDVRRFVLCCGLFQLRANDRVRKLMREVNSLTGGSLTDQRVFNNLLLGYYAQIELPPRGNVLEFRTRRMETFEEPVLIRQPDSGLTTTLLPHHLFPRYVHQPVTNEYVVHPCVGGSLENKLAFFRDMGITPAPQCEPVEDGF